MKNGNSLTKWCIMSIPCRVNLQKFCVICFHVFLFCQNKNFLLHFFTQYLRKIPDVRRPDSVFPIQDNFFYILSIFACNIFRFFWWFSKKIFLGVKKFLINFLNFFKFVFLFWFWLEEEYFIIRWRLYHSQA